MSTETAYMRHLRKWLKEMERDEAQGRLSDLERADMRAMKWAVESLRVGVEAIRDAGVARSASYQAARRQEFAERRENRTALKALKRLRSVVLTVSDPQVLASVDGYLKQKHTSLVLGKGGPFNG